MRIALIGLADTGARHYELLRERDEKIVAICDNDKDRLAKFACRRKYTNEIKMLRDTDPDTVHITVRGEGLAEMIIDALSLGINVVCEEPLELAATDVPRILAAEEASSATLGVYSENDFTHIKSFAETCLGH